ncbi:MAG TPA: POTRA domain-containing protein [Hanamia sp.]|nr:POTRA domain-containing protein [Hanamia sp.]
MPHLLTFTTGSFYKSDSYKKRIKRQGFFALKLVLFFSLLHFVNAAKAQDQSIDTTFISSPRPDYLSTLRVRHIVVSGNKKTKKYIILREMSVKEGDSIWVSNLNATLLKSRDLIYNTTLFIDVTVLPLFIDANEVDIIVDVKERWYIFPIPYLELADRSFNEWVDKYNASFNRLSYGVMFSHFNISGRKDQLSLILVNGFKRNISFEYSAPYTNPALTDGVKFGAGYIQTREIPFASDANNNLLYYKSDHFVKNEWYVRGSYSSRKRLKKKETFTITFRHLNVDDSVVSHYNPYYFNSTSSSQDFFDFEYKLEFRDVDNVLYPLKGYAAAILLKKRGLELIGGMNQFSIKPSYGRYFSHRHNWYTSVRLSGELKLPFDQSYYNLKALGYEEDYLRGDEYFVIDGVAFGLAKFDLKKKILHFDLPTVIRSNTYNKIPFTFYAKAFADVGYVYGQPQYDSRLANKFLYSGGMGIDILTLYDFKLRIEYSLNQLNQKGLFLHR